MNKLTIQTIWVDNSEPDFIELNFKVANDKQSANFSSYASVHEIKKIFGNDYTGKILSGEKQKWGMQGSALQSVTISGELLDHVGIIALLFNIVFDKEKESIPAEQSTIILKI